MSRWFVQDGKQVKELDEEHLRRKLGSGDYTGLELAHPEGDLAWQPLHAWPVFAEVVPFEGSAEAAAIGRARKGFISHALAFAAVIGFLTLQSGAVPGWSIFWLLGLAMHGVRVLPAFQSGSVEAEAEPEAVTSPVAALPEPVTLQEVRPAGFLGQVEALLHELARTAGDRVDVAALREGAEALERALASLQEAADPEEGARLQQALADAEERVHTAPDEASAEVFHAEAQAIVARLEAFGDAATAVSRLQARQRTLLHQLETLRLDLARGDTPASPAADPVRTQVARLRQEALAAAEVDDSLARARKAQRTS